MPHVLQTGTERRLQHPGTPRQIKEKGLKLELGIRIKVKVKLEASNSSVSMIATLFQAVSVSPVLTSAF